MMSANYPKTHAQACTLWLGTRFDHVIQEFYVWDGLCLPSTPCLKNRRRPRTLFFSASSEHEAKLSDAIWEITPSKHIQYDARWFSDIFVCDPPLLLPIQKCSMGMLDVTISIQLSLLKYKCFLLKCWFSLLEYRCSLLRCRFSLLKCWLSLSKYTCSLLKCLFSWLRHWFFCWHIDFPH